MFFWRRAIRFRFVFGNKTPCQNQSKKMRNEKKSPFHLKAICKNVDAAKHVALRVVFSSFCFIFSPACIHLFTFVHIKFIRWLDRKYIFVFSINIFFHCLLPIFFFSLLVCSFRYGVAKAFHTMFHVQCSCVCHDWPLKSWQLKKAHI